MANPLPRAIRGRWLAIVAQVTALEVFVLLGTAFTARYHPQSRPVDVAGYGLAALAAGAIGLSPRWPVGAVGVALPIWTFFNPFNRAHRAIVGWALVVQ